MTSERPARSVQGALLAVLLLAGCASALPPERSVTDLRAIEGRWRGNIKFGLGPYEIFYLTVNPDAAIVASWGATTRWGKITLEKGKVRFDLYIWSGDLYYFEGPGSRVILMKEDFGTWDAQVTPLR